MPVRRGWLIIRRQSKDKAFLSKLLGGLRSLADKTVHLPHNRDALPVELAELINTIRHDSIIPFRGQCNHIDSSDQVFLVYPFMENGNILNYLHGHPDADRLPLLCQVADALVYLHRKGIVHGKVIANNVLISETGSALLSDFSIPSPGASFTADTRPDIYAFALLVQKVLARSPTSSQSQREARASALGRQWQHMNAAHLPDMPQVVMSLRDICS